jgi:hypothetical protein
MKEIFLYNFSFLLLCALVLNRVCIRTCWQCRKIDHRKAPVIGPRKTKTLHHQGLISSLIGLVAKSYSGYPSKQARSLTRRSGHLGFDGKAKSKPTHRGVGVKKLHLVHVTILSMSASWSRLST